VFVKGGRQRPGAAEKKKPAAKAKRAPGARKKRPSKRAPKPKA
jgi:hypothetical protein